MVTVIDACWGIAACGLALAIPHYGAPNSPVAFNSTTPPLIEESIGDHTCANPNVPNFSQLTPTSACIASAVHKPSTSKKWLRRLSESFSAATASASRSPSSLGGTISSTSSRSQSRAATASPQPSSRPSTRNKLVKRSPTERLSRANSPVPLPRLQRRPSTAIYCQPPTTTTCEQSNNLRSPSLFHVERPSTEGLELDSPRISTYDPGSVDAWRPFFTAKRSRSSQPGSGSTKLTKSSGIRRIVPDFFRRHFGPTLVIAPAVNSFPTDKNSNDDDTNSLFTDAASLNILSRPVTRMSMGEFLHPRPARKRSSTASIPTKTTTRRSFSLSNLLNVATAKNMPKDTNSNDSVVIDGDGHSGGVRCSRRHSTPDALSLHPTSNPSHRKSRPPTPAYEGIRRELLPPIKKISLINLGEQFSSSSSISLASGSPSEERLSEERLSEERLSEERLSEERLSEESTSSAPAVGCTMRPHRFSTMSALERASTLIGSESEHDFGSDTIFDSMRTRVSEVPSVRADRIFDFERSYDHRSPLQHSYDNEISTSAPGACSITSKKHRNTSPNSTRTPQQLGTPNIAHEDDEDGWGSDWDVPSKDGDDHRLPVNGGLRPHGRIPASRVGLGLQNNGSNASFGTAREGWSADTSSLRETNSILDWNDGVSVHSSSSPGSGYRPKTMHAKESLLSSTRTGRRAPAIHVRSQSMPVVNTLRGRVPLASENWDDDFMDDDDEVCEMVIPRAIEERQASIIGHLGCVREFALLVEDLKRLRESAVVKGIRYKADCELWDEADAIIALATLDDDKEDAPLKKETLHRQNNWTPQQRRELKHQLSDENNSYTLSPRNSHSVLAPDDDIFGGNESNAPSTPKYRNSKRLSPAPSISSPISRKTVDKNDPIEVAKSMMEKMQHRQRSEASRRNSGIKGKVHFDTDMLRDLVVQTKRLKQKLTRSVEGYPPSPEKNNGLRLKLRNEAPTDDQFEFDLSPIKSSFDEHSLERVNSKGLEFTPVIGVA
ncbi:hypothetical protein FN846DRAFT_892920 [Sphaerosporella brunnea]|uniref:Uncharacterized protein n=1 Tax=Sphaerosporella brunnea TaxID=1250544 RepID=A0A5J5ENR4_9PEZI|nr:hypothetical protein FN846DRAFT_892920 [Sphaerosporella brunnea]